MSADRPSRIAVAGATGYLGVPLVRALALTPGVEHVLAIGRRAIAPAPLAQLERVAYAPCDVVAGALGELLAEQRISSLVHLVFSSRPTHDERAAFDTNVAGIVRTLALAGAAGARRAVVVSSAGVYGPGSGRRLRTEADAPRPNRFLFSAHKALQELAAHESAARAGLELAIARPCTVVGGSGRNFLLELLGRPLVPVPARAQAPWQFLHVEDFCRDLVALLRSDLTGAWNLAPEQTVPLREAVRLLGGRPVAVPRPALRAAAHATWSARLGAAVPPSALPFLADPPLVCGARLRERLRLEPPRSSRDALGAARSLREAAPRVGP